MSSLDTSSPSMSMAPGAGMAPMAVSSAPSFPVPVTRSKIHSRTREFSP